MGKIIAYNGIHLPDRAGLTSRNFQKAVQMKKEQNSDNPQNPALRVGDVRQRFTYPKGCLTDSEWQELVALEYVLTWGYTDNEAKDSKRHRELSDKRWASLNVA